MAFGVRRCLGPGMAVTRPRSGIELVCRVHGEPGRPALILLHGLFGSAANWGSIARQLATGFHVLVPDLRNHGQSPHSDDHSYAAMVDDVLGLMRARGVDSAAVIGHSMGGKVAMLLALEHPGRVDRLVSVDMAPVVYAHDFDAALDAFGAVRLDRLGRRADADEQMRALVPADGLRAFLLQNLVKRPQGWAWRLNLPALAAAQRGILGFDAPRPSAVYDGPALFVHGAASDYVRPAHLPEIRRLFPAAELCEVAGAGHWVYADQPQAFLDPVVGFLNSGSPTPAERRV